MLKKSKIWALFIGSSFIYLPIQKNELLDSREWIHAIRQTAEQFLGEEICVVTLTHYSVRCHTALQVLSRFFLKMDQNFITQPSNKYY